MIDNTSHSDIIKNPEIQKFLSDSEYIKIPSEEDKEVITKLFVDCGNIDVELPKNIISVDASTHEAPVNETLPFTNVGYVRLSNFLIRKDDFFADATSSAFVDPFKIAKLSNDGEFFSFAFPGNNISYKKQLSLRDGFRLALEESFLAFKSIDGDRVFSLKDTLFRLGEYRNENSGELTLHKCPNVDCEQSDIVVKNFSEQQLCPNCKKPIYATDSLRIWEEIDENAQSNQQALTRTANVLKHLSIMHYIFTEKTLHKDTYLLTLKDLCFFVNGPLAIYGPPAWLHRVIMKAFFEVNQELSMKGYGELLVVGVIENGQIGSYFDLFKNDIAENSYYCLTDEFRKDLLFNSFGSTFGYETYYGQDFVFKADGTINVFCIPYHRKEKSPVKEFADEKSKPANYKNLSVALKLMQEFGCNLYKSALIPIVLAKKYSVISVEPGATMLNLLAKTKINEKVD